MGSKDDIFFNNGIDLWIRNLRTMVDDITSRGNTPVFVSVSMMLTRLIKSMPDRLDDIISGYEFVSDAAIPFIATDGDHKDKIEIILMDDIIVDGYALNDAYTTIKSIFEHKVAVHISAIFRYEKSDNRNLDMTQVPVISKRQVDTITGIIGDRVKQTGMPVDTMFPIFIITGNGYTKHNFYNLGDKSTVGDNVDCSLVRTYDGYMQVIASTVISGYDLTRDDHYMFGDGYYSMIWDMVTDGLRVMLNKVDSGRIILDYDVVYYCERSLAVFANWLYSLSTFMLNIDCDIFNGIRDDVKLDTDALTLLVGKYHAYYISELIDDIIYYKETVKYPRCKYYRIPSSFTPVKFDGCITDIKTQVGIECGCDKSALDRLFDSMHYGNPNFSNPYITIGRMHFGETLKSLKDVMEMFNKDFDSENEVLSYINDKTDSGYIKSDYERVNDDTRACFWKLYYHPTIRKLM